MRNISIAIVILSFISLSAFVSNSFRSIDTSKSKVSFEIGNMGVRTVEGTFTGMTGKIVFDKKDLANSSLQACILATTVSTGSEKRDEHLKNEDFFDVKKHPKICFTSTAIKPTKTGYIAKGKLSIHGVTRFVELPFTYKNGFFAGNLVINRKDYKVGETTNTFMVSNEVEIKIHTYLMD